jgi:hypothetical protein
MIRDPAEILNLRNDGFIVAEEEFNGSALIVSVIGNEVQARTRESVTYKRQAMQ